MYTIQSLTPDQIKALTPNCLKVLLAQDEDIAKLKYYFDTLKYMSHPKISTVLSPAQYDESAAQPMREILLKYPTTNFYLTHDYLPNHDINQGFTSVYIPLNWKLHTQEELIATIPDIDKLCFGKGSKPIANIPYPNHYLYKNGDPITHIEQLSWFHSNLKFIHPILLDCYTHFQSK